MELTILCVDKLYTIRNCSLRRCNGLPPEEAISSSTRPKFVGAKARPIITRLNSDPYRNSTAFSNSASLPSLSITTLPLYIY
ncbi:hypothetical protein TNCV_1711631 [Trichonephila clavipes]|nr:hypothetical protein TNCV_1711631 [Trichonephila clavipes]